MINKLTPTVVYLDYHRSFRSRIASKPTGDYGCFERSTPHSGYSHCAAQGRGESRRHPHRTGLRRRPACYPCRHTCPGHRQRHHPCCSQITYQALLNGDVTPLHDPVVDFNSLYLEQTSTEIVFDSCALIRDSQLVRFTAAGKRPSLKQQLETIVRQRVQSARDAIFAPGKKRSRALRLVYSQLPYHPQRIWAGTQFIADLNQPAIITLPAEPPVPSAETASLNGINVTARLADTTTQAPPPRAIWSTRSSHSRCSIQATRSSQRVRNLKERSRKAGLARSFGRNGQLLPPSAASRGPGRHWRTCTVPSRGPKAMPARTSPSTPRATLKRILIRIAFWPRCCWRLQPLQVVTMITITMVTTMSVGRP